MLRIGAVLVFVLVPAMSCMAQGEPNEALLFKLKTPDHRIRHVAFSPDGKLVAAAYGFSDEGGVTIWNVEDRSVVATLLHRTKQQAGIVRIAFSTDGAQFAAATEKGDVLLWKVGAWRTPKTILEKQGSPRDLSFSSTKLGFASDDVALLYDLKTARIRVLATKAGVGQSYRGISFTPDGKIVAVCGAGQFWLWDVENEQRASVWETKSATGFFGRLSPNGSYLIAGGGPVFGKKTVHIWNVDEQKQIAELTKFRNGLFSVAISNSSKLFAVAGGTYGDEGELGGELSLWSIDDARELGFTSYGKYPIQGLAFNRDDTVLAAGSEDGFVLLYDVARLRGPVITKQASPLCGEIAVEGNRAFIRALTKVPIPMRDFGYPWKFEIINSELVAGLVGSPVVLENWSIETNAGTDRARITSFHSLLRSGSPRVSDYIVFGYVQNPGWDEGFAAKVYADGSFVAASSAGKCKAYGSLEQLKTDFESVTKRLVSRGLLDIAKEPRVLGADHYSTAFIELTINGVAELRTDADDIGVLLSGGPAKKRQAFSVIYKPELEFIKALLEGGMKLPRN